MLGAVARSTSEARLPELAGKSLKVSTVDALSAVRPSGPLLDVLDVACRMTFKCLTCRDHFPANGVVRARLFIPVSSKHICYSNIQLNG